MSGTDNQNRRTPDAPAPLANNPFARLLEAQRAKAAGQVAGIPVPPSAPTPTESNEPPMAPHMEVFSDVLAENPTFGTLWLNLVMVTELLQESLNSGAPVTTEMGFDQKNLEKLMQAVFGVSRGEILTLFETRSRFNQSNYASGILYKEILDLDENADRETMKRKLTALLPKVTRLENLLRQNSGLVVGVLREAQEDTEKKAEILMRNGFEARPVGFIEAEMDQALQSAKVTDENERKAVMESIQLSLDGAELSDPNERTAAIAQIYGVLKAAQVTDMTARKAIIAKISFGPAPIRLDEQEIENMLQEVKSRVSVSGYLEKRKTMLVYEPLKRLQELVKAPATQRNALLAANFNGVTLEALQKQIDDLFLPASNMGAFLMEAAKDGRSVEAILRMMVEKGDLKDSADLDSQLRDLYNLFCGKYPNALAEADPVRKTIDEKLTTLFDSLMNQNQGKCALPYWYIGYALQLDEATYESQYRHTLFNGMDRATMMTAIDSVTRPGFAGELMSAAKSGENYKTALFKRIAFVSGLSVDDLKFRHLVVALAVKLGELFPEICIIRNNA